MQNTLWSLLPVELVTNILKQVKYNKYKKLRLVCKELKQIVDAEVSEIIPRLMMRRRNDVCEYVERWMAIYASMLMDTAALDGSPEEEGDENDHFDWGEAMNKFDREAIIFISQMAVLFQDTVLHDLPNFCFYIPCRDQLRRSCSWVALMMGMHDPSRCMLKMYMNACKYDEDGTASNAIESCMIMEDDRMVDELGHTIYATYREALKFYNKNHEKWIRNISAKKRNRDSYENEMSEMNDVEMQEFLPM